MENIDSISLKDLIKDKISELGEKAPEFFGVSAGMVAQWSKDIKPPSLGAAEKVFSDYMAKAQLNSQELPKTDTVSVETEEKGEFSDCVILTPLGKGYAPNIHTQASGNRMIKNRNIQWIYDQGNPTIRARNNLARIFLQGKWNWALWVDDDMFLQSGDAEHFNNRLDMCGLKPYPPNLASLNTLDRLRSHNTPIISALYYGRGPKHGALFAEANMNPQVSSESRKFFGLRKTEWFGFGCVLTHRKLFEKVLEMCPEVKTDNTMEHPHEFFTPDLSVQRTSGGEDVSFCKRVERSGITMYIDCSVRPGHIGNMIFTAENTHG